MADNLERLEQVYYALFSSVLGRKVIQEPRSWESDFKSYERDPDSKAITSKTTVDLEFYGSGADYIDTIRANFGISEPIRLAKYEKSRTSLSEQFELRYIQRLDLTTYKRDEKSGAVKIKATNGGLHSDIKSRETDDFDLINSISADGVDIGNIETVPFQPKGREIFVESLLEGYSGDFKVNSDDTLASTTFNVRTIPMQIVYNSDQEDIVEPFRGQPQFNSADHQEANNSNAIGSETHIADTFLFQAETDKTVTLDLTLDLRITEMIRRGSNIQPIVVELRKSELVNNINVLKEKTTIFTISDPLNSIGTQYNITHQATVDLLRNESLGYVITTIKPSGDRRLKYTFEVDSRLVVEDITAYADYTSVSRAVKPLTFFDRIVSKITGESGLVRSTIFEPGGEYENILVDCGLWARGFPDTYTDAQDAEQTIQMSISFKDAFDSFSYLEPLTWFVELEGTKEYIRIEKATYTMQNFIALKLGEVDGIETEESAPDYFSSVTIGHSKSLEYEEVNGRDEYNGKSNFNTHIKENTSKYEVISKIRFDSTGYELTRREDFTNNPKSDNKRDADLWLHDAKLINGIYTHKLWPDRFDSAPEGIYSPDTAWNLWLSPMNRLFYGHGYSVKRGLYHFPSRSIVFGSSNANENLKTTINGFELSENGAILVGDINKPRVEATKKNLTFKMNQSIQDTLDGYTEVNGLRVPNVFGLIEYKENGESTYVRLTKLENKDEAKLTAIKARL